MWKRLLVGLAVQVVVIAALALFTFGIWGCNGVLLTSPEEPQIEFTWAGTWTNEHVSQAAPTWERVAALQAREPCVGEV